MDRAALSELRHLIDLFMRYACGAEDAPTAVLATREYRYFQRLYEIKGRRCTYLNKVAMTFYETHPHLVEEILYDTDHTDSSHS